MTFTIKRSQKRQQLKDQIILLYGKAKIGKSTIASQFPDPVFIETEPGLNHLEVNKIPCYTWESFLKIKEALVRNDIYHCHSVYVLSDNTQLPPLSSWKVL